MVYVQTEELVMTQLEFVLVMIDSVEIAVKVRKFLTFMFLISSLLSLSRQSTDTDSVNKSRAKFPPVHNV